MKVLITIKKIMYGSTVQLPNKGTMIVTRKEKIPLACSIRAHEKKVHIFDVLHSDSLFYLCQMCDNDCVAILDKNGINIHNSKTLIIKGHRNNKDGLWDIPISLPSRLCYISIITKDKTKP